MTKKHFIALAKAIALIDNLYHRGQVAALVADVCRQNNPRFDRARFLAACGV